MPANFSLGLFTAPGTSGSFYGLGANNLMTYYYSGPSSGHTWFTGANGPTGSVSQGTQRMVLTSAGLLGLNNTAPQFNLDVSGSANIYTANSGNSLFVTAGGTLGALRLTNLNGVNYIQSGATLTNNSIAPLTLGGALGSSYGPVWIGTNSCIGINNIAPQNSLDVIGGAYVTGSLTLGTASTGILQLIPGYYFNGTTTQASANAAWLGLPGYGTLSFNDALSVFGNVGIYTTAPAYPLDVVGTIANSALAIRSAAGTITVAGQTTANYTLKLPPVVATTVDSTLFCDTSGNTTFKMPAVSAVYRNTTITPAVKMYSNIGTTTGGTCSFYPTSTGLVTGTAIFATIWSVQASARSSTAAAQNVPLCSVKTITGSFQQVTINAVTGAGVLIGGVTAAFASDGTTIDCLIIGI